MNYKGYSASIEYDQKDQVFCGKIKDIEDLVLFEGSTIEEIEYNFKEAVDMYLEDACRI